MAYLPAMELLGLPCLRLPLVPLPPLRLPQRRELHSPENESVLSQVIR
jgi:hypothetical protein